MKNLNSSAAVLACLALSACGGGGGAATPPPTPTSASIGGTLAGSPDGIVLLNNAGTETIALSAVGSFSFTKRVAEGNTYNVTVLGEPNGTSCEVANGKGTVGHGVDSVANVSVSCTGGGFMLPFTSFHVGVTVTGLLPGNSVALTNDQNETLTATENGLLVFSWTYITAAISAGRPGGYEVTVRTQPANQSCTVRDGSGTMTDTSDFVNLLVSCN